MKIAIFSKYNDPNTIKTFLNTLEKCKNKNIDTIVYKANSILLKQFQSEQFEEFNELIEFKPDFLFSVGGDGTLLDSLLVIKDSGIPVIGINTGRLGFLANNQGDEIDNVLKKLENNQFTIENRSVIELISNDNLFKFENYALNEFTIHKGNNSTLVTITAFINNELFNTYWCDGLILSTPTGSTAYSMSCGGPIVMPDSNTFILTPVAPHNLNVRPVIIPDHLELKFEIIGRNNDVVVSLDSRFSLVNKNINFSLRKAGFYFKTCKFNNQNFSKIIREKLNWGIDKRNPVE